jgi:hypothetical protein
MIKEVADPRECDALAGLYGEERSFRSRANRALLMSSPAR